MRTHKAWVVSSNPARVPMETPLVRKPTGNQLINPLGKNHGPVSGFCYARNRVCNAAAPYSIGVDNPRLRVRMRLRDSPIVSVTVEVADVCYVEMSKNGNIRVIVFLFIVSDQRGGI